MKKIITLLMLVAVAVTAQAQSLTGKNWFTNQSDTLLSTKNCGRLINIIFKQTWFT